MSFHSQAFANRRLVPAVVGVLLIATAAVSAQGVKLDVAYVPTPPEVVDRMLSMAGVQKGDFLIDLGSGDGRIPITAAKKYGARGFGVDINPERVAEASANAQREGVADQVEFRVQNLYDTDLSKADVLSMYLLQQINDKLRPRVLEELRPGARVVSHAFDMDPWKPDQEAAIGIRKVYMWVVPAKIGGRWHVEGGELSFGLQIDQQFQHFTGQAEMNGQSVTLRNPRLKGAEVSFEVDVGGQSRTFRGTMKGEAIEGGQGSPGSWKATRRSS